MSGLLPETVVTTVTIGQMAGSGLHLHEVGDCEVLVERAGLR
jgi:hypothetical protein